MPRNLRKRGQTWWYRIRHQGQDHEGSLETDNLGQAKERLGRKRAELIATGWGEKPRRTFNHRVDAYSAPALGKRRPHGTDGGKPKWHNAVELNRSGFGSKGRALVACINVHMVTHAAGPHAYAQQLEALCNLAERRPGVVTNLGGDLNSIPNAPRLSALRKITTGWHSHPTHGRGDALDQVPTLKTKGSKQ